MFIQILSASALGILSGIVTGLIPGIHINLIAVFVLANVYRFHSINSLAVASFIMAMSITHTFLDFIPSVFLGAPDDDTALALLPAHRMLAEGKGYEAVMTSVVGSLSGLIMIVLLAPLLLVAIPNLYEGLEKLLVWILILIVASSVGIVCSVVGVRKSHLMACLMIPILLFFI